MQSERKESMRLKWGSVKAWQIHNPDTLALLQKWADLGVSASAISQQNTPEQKEILCQVIDALNCDTIHLDWEYRDVTKEEAKHYIRTYGQDTTD